jgi:hypothetical protein
VGRLQGADIKRINVTRVSYRRNSQRNKEVTWINLNYQRRSDYVPIPGVVSWKPGKSRTKAGAMDDNAVKRAKKNVSRRKSILDQLK